MTLLAWEQKQIYSAAVNLTLSILLHWPANAISIWLFWHKWHMPAVMSTFWTSCQQNNNNKIIKKTAKHIHPWVLCPPLQPLLDGITLTWKSSCLISALKRYRLVLVCLSERNSYVWNAGICVEHNGAEKFAFQLLFLHTGPHCEVKSMHFAFNVSKACAAYYTFNIEL